MIPAVPLNLCAEPPVQRKSYSIEAEVLFTLF